MNIVALIPARAGSKRIPGKNTKLLAGHPLIAYTIAAAQDSGIFHNVCIATDDKAVRSLAPWDGATYFHSRHEVPDTQPDIEWVRDALEAHGPYDAFAILRPTSPFRTAATIRRAFEQFQRSEAHSIRAVQPVKEHPGKMWFHNVTGYPMTPVHDATLVDGTPWHSAPTQTLPKVYVQNASLEIAWTYVVKAFGTISGTKIAPFFTDGYEGFDINTPEDWEQAERLIADGKVTLPDLAVRA